MSPTGKPPALGIGSEIAHRSRKFTLALSPIRDTHSEGFSYFVTSIAAPAASGWSVRRVGLAPTGKRRLITAHTHSGHRAAERPCGFAASRAPAASLSVGVLAPSRIRVLNIKVLTDRFCQLCKRRAARVSRKRER